MTDRQLRPVRGLHLYRVRTMTREKCRVCGYLPQNVRHELDPDNAPEGKAYYDAMRDELHEFVPSGVFEP